MERTVEPIAQPGVSDRFYRPTKLAAVVDALLRDGVPVDHALRDLGVTLSELHSRDALVSLEQLLTACRSATRLSRNPILPYRIGSSIHVSTYGMYGYAILCSTDFRRTFDFCVRYHVLAAPLVGISFAERGGMCAWTIDPILHGLVDEQLYRFIVEMQMGVHVSLQRDVMGSAFTPHEITLTYPRREDFRLTEELVGCKLSFSHPANQLIFDAKWLDRPANLGNQMTYAAVVAMCDELLADLRFRSGVVGKVRAHLLQDIAKRPTLADVAERLGSTARTVRRQLNHQGTSFRALLDELRSQIAMKYLRDTVMTSEDIAVSLGFSDAANFRHAFRRWTGKTPSEFRHGAQRSV
ncbi:MAG TPA: AraC family transcriptional regulator [Roseiarcus sp.]|jgi:AraC-like DNA-binding protein